MIAKITSGNNFYGAANYNQKKVTAGQATILHTQKLRSTRPQSLNKTFENLNNSIIRKPVFHASLSFHKADAPKLDDAKMLALAKTYLKELGYDKQPYIVYRHHDTEHPHVHILTSRVDITTQKKIPDSYENTRSKEITDRLEQEHDLTISDQQQVVKQEIVADLEKVLQQKKPENIAQLNNALAQTQIPVRAEATSKGLIYYKIGADGQRNSRSFRASYYKDAQLDSTSLQTRFQAHIQDRQYVQEQIKVALPETPSSKTSIGVFSKQLQEKGITADFKVKDDQSIDISYRYKEHLYQDATLTTTAQKQLVFPSPQDFELREQLTRSIAANEPLELKYQNDQLRASTPNAALEKELNKRSQGTLLELSSIYNKYRVQHERAGNTGFRNAVLALAATDIEDTLQQKINQERQLKRST